MYETWGSKLDDWDSREYANDDLIDALYTARLLQSPVPLPLTCTLFAVCLPGTGCIFLQVNSMQGGITIRKWTSLAPHKGF